MKKLIVIPCLFFAGILLSVHMNARDITVYKTAAGPHGYDKIVETHTETGDGLSCYNPGYSACEWVIKPSCNIFLAGGVEYSVTGDIVPHVEQLLQQNQLQGQYIIPNSNVLVTWAGTGPTDYTLIISIN